jgi:hypothetical protein
MKPSGTFLAMHLYLKLNEESNGEPRTPLFNGHSRKYIYVLPCVAAFMTRAISIFARTYSTCEKRSGVFPL